MKDFYPKEIYLDQSVKDLDKTQEILSRYPHLPVHVITERSQIKYPQNHTRAKQQLYLARHQGQSIKACQGMGDYVCCQYYTIALVSDCHLECTYCILQDYLKNNPVITFFVNTSDIFAEIQNKISKHPQKIFRIGTGELSDSLALDHIHGFSKDCVDFANTNRNVLLELKTKTANIGKLLSYKHGGNVIVSWSVNPQDYIETEEHKCDSLNARLDAARQCADAGYPVAFHFDPLLHYPDWEKEYEGVVDAIAGRFKSKEIAWISLGTLRFTKELKKISQERFPKSRLMTGELFPSADGKVRSFRPLREQIYRHMSDLVRRKLAKVPYYLCMETPTVWKNVFKEIPTNNSELERRLVKNFTSRDTGVFADAPDAHALQGVPAQTI